MCAGPCGAVSDPAPPSRPPPARLPAPSPPEGHGVRHHRRPGRRRGRHRRHLPDRAVVERQRQEPARQSDLPGRAGAGLRAARRPEWADPAARPAGRQPQRLPAAPRSRPGRRLDHDPRRPPRRGAPCVVTWEPSTQLFRDPCPGRTYPPDGPASSGTRPPCCRAGGSRWICANSSPATTRSPPARSRPDPRHEGKRGGGVRRGGWGMVSTPRSRARSRTRAGGAAWPPFGCPSGEGPRRSGRHADVCSPRGDRLPSRAGRPR